MQHYLPRGVPGTLFLDSDVADIAPRCAISPYACRVYNLSVHRVMATTRRHGELGPLWRPAAQRGARTVPHRCQARAGYTASPVV
eukprot:705820-Prorocentrum_minimum.AAC.3